MKKAFLIGVSLFWVIVALTMTLGVLAGRPDGLPISGLGI